MSTATAEKIAAQTTVNAAQDPAAAPLVEQTRPAPGRPAVALTSGNKLGAIIPNDFEQVYRLAKAIATAGWAPKAYMDGQTFSAEKISIGIMQGLEIGLSPLASLQSIAVINGMPSIFGDGALGVVYNSGLVEDFKEEPIKDAAGTVTGYRCTAKRRGRNTPITHQFTVTDAQNAGLLEKTGPWKQYRTRMLQMRARAWVLRDGFADVLRGLHIAEEAMDIVDVTPTNQTAAPQKPAAAPTTAKGALDVFSDAGGTVAPAAAAEAPVTTPAQPETAKPAAETAADTAAGMEARITARMANLPEPPADAVTQWAENRKWGLCWRWIAGAADNLPDREAVQALVDKYREVLMEVKAHSDAYSKAVDEFIAKHGVTLNHEPNQH